MKSARASRPREQEYVAIIDGLTECKVYDAFIPRITFWVLVFTSEVFTLDTIRLGLKWAGIEHDDWDWIAQKILKKMRIQTVNENAVRVTA